MSPPRTRRAARPAAGAAGTAERVDARRERITGSVEEALGKLTGIDLLETRGAERARDGKAREAAAPAPAASAKRGGRGK